VASSGAAVGAGAGAGANAGGDAGDSGLPGGVEHGVAKVSVGRTSVTEGYICRFHILRGTCPPQTSFVFEMIALRGKVEEGTMKNILLSYYSYLFVVQSIYTINAR
jgi:hypothetical protein